MAGRRWRFSGNAGFSGHCFLGWHAFPQHDVEYNADADAENGHGDERTAPAPGNGDAGGDERCQEVAETAADQVNAECPAAGSWLYHRRYHYCRGGMVTAAQYAHQRETDNQYDIVWRHTDQQPGSAHANDADGEQDAWPDAVRQPSRRQLANAVNHAKHRYDKSGTGVIQREFVTDVGQERHRQRGHQVVGKMCQHKQGHQSAQEGTQAESTNNGDFLSVAKAVRREIVGLRVSYHLCSQGQPPFPKLLPITPALSSILIIVCTSTIP